VDVEGGDSDEEREDVEGEGDSEDKDDIRELVVYIN